MRLALRPPLPPMEAKSAEELPAGPGWQFEPKWDGFRCLAFKDRGEVELQSKAGKPLGRYFPEVVAAVRRLPVPRLVLDGELVVPRQGRLDFDQLLQRIHPAASRVERLAAESPASCVLFDLLLEEDEVLLERPLLERRRRLEELAERHLTGHDLFQVTPATRRRDVAAGWLAGGGVDLDGVVAKELAAAYRAGERAGMVKVKAVRTADCVVGGVRRGEGGRLASLLLGLYDEDGLLHHVGFAASFTAEERRRLADRVRPLVGGAGFSGRAPGGPSRWRREGEGEWEPLAPELVVEVRYDHVSGGRFRHGTKLLRERPDKAAKQCTFEQLPQGSGWVG